MLPLNQPRCSASLSRGTGLCLSLARCSASIPYLCLDSVPVCSTPTVHPFTELLLLSTPLQNSVPLYTIPHLCLSALLRFCTSVSILCLFALYRLMNAKRDVHRSLETCIYIRRSPLTFLEKGRESTREKHSMRMCSRVLSSRKGARAREERSLLTWIYIHRSLETWIYIRRSLLIFLEEGHERTREKHRMRMCFAHMNMYVKRDLCIYTHECQKRPMHIYSCHREARNADVLGAHEYIRQKRPMYIYPCHREAQNANVLRTRSCMQTMCF